MKLPDLPPLSPSELAAGAGAIAAAAAALRVSLKLLRAKLVLERLGVSPTNAAAALQPNIVTNPARVEIEWRPR